MRQNRIFAGLAILAGAAAVVGYSTTARSADHFDPPASATNTATDIGDVYAWMSDANTVTLVMTVYPQAPTLAKFDPNVQYVFHTFSSAMGGAAQLLNVNQPTKDIIATFDAGGGADAGAAQQNISLWVGTSEFVTGNAGGATGLSSADGKVKVFAGLRADPFFANFAGFLNTVSTVETVGPSLMKNDAGCPLIDAGTAATLQSLLSHSADGGTPANFFQTLNVLALVVNVDKSLLAPSQFLSVRAGTYLTGTSITDAGGQ